MGFGSPSHYALFGILFLKLNSFSIASEILKKEVVKVPIAGRRHASMSFRDTLRKRAAAVTNILLADYFNGTDLQYLAFLIYLFDGTS
jgi:hypothetical protein